MTGYEYALRTVTVASGQAFEIAHAVAPGTLIALCGTVAVPEPGSRWADSDPASRCEACERVMQASVPVDVARVEPAPAEPAPAEPAPVDPVAVDPAPVEPAAAEDRPGAADRVRGLADRGMQTWRRLGRRVQIGIGAGAFVVVAVVAVVLTIGGGFHADPNSAAYKNGYAYGLDLMSPSDDITGSCTQATVDDPTSTAGKNFIAGCQAGYAARTP